MKNQRLLVALLLLSLAVNVGTFVHGMLANSVNERNSLPAAELKGATLLNTREAFAVGHGRANKNEKTNPTGPRTAEEIRVMAERLQAAGLPRYLTRQTLIALLAHEEAERDIVPKTPYWQLSDLAQQGLEMKLRQKQQSLVDDALGFGAAEEFYLSPVGRLRRFGDLPPEKIAALLRVERDYREIGQAELRVNGTPSADELARGQLIQAARRQDIMAVLSADELVQYDRRNSAGARQVAAAVSGVIDITEAEFFALSKVHDQFIADRPSRPHEVAPDHAQIRAILDDDRFYAYIARADPVYKTIDYFARTQPGLAPAKAYELYQLQRAVWSVRDASGLDSPESRQQLAALNSRLELLLGVEGAKAYRTKSQFGAIFAYPTQH